MKITRRLRSLIIFVLLMSFLLGASIVLRNFILHRIKAGIQASLNYAKIHMSVVPPSVTLEDVRTISSSPFFSARKITFRISYLTLLKRDKPLRVLVEQPVLRVYESPGSGAKEKFKLRLPLPFSIERGNLRDGEFYYWGKGTSISAQGVKALFRQKKDTFALQVESSGSTLLSDAFSSPLTVKIRAAIEGKENELTFQRLSVEGSGFVVKANGVLSNIEDPKFEFRTSLHFPARMIAEFFDLPFDWGGTTKGEGFITRRQGRTAFQAGLTSDDIVLNSIPLGGVEGKVTVGGEEGGRVELVLQKRPNPREYVDIAFGGGRVEGTARGLHLDPIIHDLALPWPVKSGAWGDFSVENGRLQVRAEFKDDLLIHGPERFPFRGPVNLTWDGEKKVVFGSEKLESSFGALEVEGAVDIGRDVRVAIRGDVSDVKQGREFTELILGEQFGIPEIRGKGHAEIKILGDYHAPQVKIDFSTAPGGFDAFNAASVSGLVEIGGGEVTGIFKVQDPDMRGSIRLLSKHDALDVRIQADDASLEKILPSLDLRIPLKGRAAGNFEITEKGKDLQVKGDFSSPGVDFLGQALKDVRGKLEWTEGANVLAFPDLEAGLYGGHIKGAGFVSLKGRDFDCDVRASDLNLSTLYPELTGRASFNLKGKGSLDKDPASGKFSARDLQYSFIEQMEAGGDVEVNYRDNTLNVKLEGFLDPGHNDFSLSFSYPQADKSYQATLKGNFFNPDLFLPWEGAQGSVSYLAEIKGPRPSPQVSGLVDFKGSVFPFPKFAQAVTDYSGLVFIQNNRASIRSLQAKLGGGDVFGTGEIRFGNRGLEFIDVRAEGKDMVLAFLERARALADGSLRLLKDETQFALSGDFQVKNLSWKRELSEKFFFSSPPYLEQKRERGFFDDLALDIRLWAEDNAALENSLGQVQGRFDLTIGGNISSPIILGDIEGLRGDVYFQDRKFKILKARLSFFNPSSIEPYLDFRGETFLRDYRVTFALSGLVNRLRPEFASSPPLPPEDVLALLALGESFKRTYSFDTSSQLSTGSLLSFQLAEEAQKRAERLFSLDRFRVDPFVLGASTEMTARLTVGKKISRDLVLLYSTNLTAQREEIVRLEWEFSDSFSLVGMRDERGRFSFDAKVRKRF